MTIDAPALLARLDALAAAGARPRARDAAAMLGAPEAALLEARRLRGEATPLRRPDGPEGFVALLASLGAVGEAMALTRNESCVHEKTGVYAAPTFHGGMGQTLGEIDLRLFPATWAHGYAVHDPESPSLQFFDAAGAAVHKVYATEATDAGAWEALVDRIGDHAVPAAAFAPPAPPEAARPDAEVDRAALRAGWAALEHSHDFFALLRRVRATRAQAMRLGGPDFARPVGRAAARAALEAASAGDIPLMIFVGNAGCVQIHAGPVRRIETRGPWLNVVDPRFNLHLREDRIAAAWIVRKPSVRGDVHSLELFDRDGFCFAQFFGERRPGETERADWRALARGLA
jgi:putative hemin transport protein